MPNEISLLQKWLGALTLHREMSSGYRIVIKPTTLWEERRVVDRFLQAQKGAFYSTHLTSHIQGRLSWRWINSTCKEKPNILTTTWVRDEKLTKITNKYKNKHPTHTRIHFMKVALIIITLKCVRSASHKKTFNGVIKLLFSSTWNHHS